MLIQYSSYNLLNFFKKLRGEKGNMQELKTKKPAKSAGKVQSSPPYGIEVKTSKNWTRPNVTTIALSQGPKASETVI